MSSKHTGLKDAIERNSLNQRELARALGVAPETITRWKSGERVPSGSNLMRLVAYLRQHEPTLQAEELF